MEYFPSLHFVCKSKSIEFDIYQVQVGSKQKANYITSIATSVFPKSQAICAIVCFYTIQYTSYINEAWVAHIGE
jgi:hypothetical protein